MSSILDKLLKGQKVEWLSLGEVCLIADNLRKPVKSSLRVAGDTPYYGANNIQDYVEGYTHDGEYVLIAEDGSASLENYSIQWVEGKFWANNHVHVVKGKEKLKSRFLFHFLRFMNFIPYLTGGDRAKLTKAKMVEILIPIPPLDVQAKIVKILDAFTALTAELTAELTMREKQYHYYRDNLLTFSDDEVEWKKLGEVVNIKNGKDWKNLDQGNVPVYGSGGIMTYVDKASYNNVSVLIPRKGSITNIFYTEQPFWNVDTIFYTEIDESQIFPKFFFHFMKNFDLTSLSTDTTRPSLTQAILNKILIPLPSLERQKHIANTLDKFEILTKSINEGLPKEIALRQKQYEYYREQLLDFPKN